MALVRFLPAFNIVSRRNVNLAPVLAQLEEIDAYASKTSSERLAAKYLDKMGFTKPRGRPANGVIKRQKNIGGVLVSVTLYDTDVVIPDLKSRLNVRVSTH